MAVISYNNRQISKMLGISERTVTNHLGRIYDKKFSSDKQELLAKFEGVSFFVMGGAALI